MAKTKRFRALLEKDQSSETTAITIPFDVDAKKPETRARRIEKAISELAPKRQAQSV